MDGNYLPVYFSTGAVTPGNLVGRIKELEESETETYEVYYRESFVRPMYRFK